MRKITKTLLESSRVEKDVENAYRAEISFERPQALWSSPYGTDGVVTWGNVRLLLEAKYDKDFKTRMGICTVLGQMILYLKKFEQAGEVLPNVLLVGDKNECFVLSTESVRGFLSLDLDWSVAPSKGSPELTRALVQGFNLLPYVYDVDANLDFKQVLSRVEALSEGGGHNARATLHNLGTIFLYWKDRVFQDPNLSPVDQADVFLRCLFQPEEVYLHPKKKGVLVVPGYSDEVRVNAEQYQSFFDHFSQGYKPSEVETFYAMKDRLIEDDARRRQGAFFTPTLWVDEAHKEIARVLGPDWRKECVVWDPAAGTANLTRDYHDWRMLISSTAERSDVQVMKDQGWGGKHVFQYDFLNPGSASPFFEGGGQNVLPESVDKALRAAAREGKRLVFLMNPPYGTANVAGTTGRHKSGIALTAVNATMKGHVLGGSSQQLYAQFMFRCSKLAAEYGFAESTVAVFSKPTFMSSGSYRPFRDWWYAKHGYGGGFLFQASHFADVSGRWGISFTVWNSGGTTDSEADLPIRLCDLQDFSVLQGGIKTIYNSDGREASQWVRAPLLGVKGADAPQMSSGLKITERSTARGSLAPGALGYMVLLGNNMSNANDGTYPLSSTSSRGNGYSYHASNWRRTVALYGARKLITETWDTQKDEYLVPDETLHGYEQWVNDCHVYTLLHTSNNCTAMRNVPYKGKNFRLKNHWFWRTRASTLDSLDASPTLAMYRDAQAEPTKESDINPITGGEETNPWELSGDAYMAHLISTGSLSLSPDAHEVLDLLDALWLKSLPYRESYYASRSVTDKDPDLHLHAWDAGLFQCKHLFRELYPEEWKELQNAFQVLADRLKPGVYTYGFLRK